MCFNAFYLFPIGLITSGLPRLSTLKFENGFLKNARRVAPGKFTVELNLKVAFGM